MAILEPNHRCKNIHCRKMYYACDHCDKSQNWRSVACSRECFDEYQKQVLEARSKGKSIDLNPERTDISKTEFDEMMKKSPENILAKTKEDLKDYSEKLEEEGLDAVIEEINKDIRKQNSAKKLSTKRKQKNVEQNL